jgi:hypothetical protein
MKRQTSLFKLFITFLKVGLFTFGGGYAMIPLIQRVVVEDEGWLTYKEMLDIIIIAESTPVDIFEYGHVRGLPAGRGAWGGFCDAWTCRTVGRDYHGDCLVF